MAKVRLGDVARERKETCNGDKEHYPVVGLEHLIPGDVTLSRWDEGKDNTFTKMFRKGDILFGRRRAYLKKAAVALFDGICSGDITVIESIADRVLPELLPFIIQSERFFDFAVENSAGSLSPRVKWEHLSKYTFELPEMDEQRRLAVVLWAANDTKEAYRRLLTKTDELVKAQFVEMFGDLSVNPLRWSSCKLIEACRNSDDIKCGPFGTQLSKSEYKQSGIALWGIPQINSAFTQMPTDYLSEEKAEQLKAYSIQAGDIAMSRKGNVGLCAIFPASLNNGIIHSDVLRIRVNMALVNSVFLVAQLHLSPAVQRQIDMVSAGAIMAGVNVTKLKEISIYVPPIDIQNSFADFVMHSDQSKLAIQQSLTRLEQTRTALMDKAFG